MPSSARFDAQVALALEALGTFYKENTLANRRNLRSDIEKRRTAVNRDFLGAFHRVHEQVTSLERQVQAMSELCAAMQSRLAVAREETAQLTGPVAALEKEWCVPFRRNAIWSSGLD